VPRLVGRFRQALRGGGRSQVGWDQIGDREDHKDAGRAIADAAKNGDRLSRAMLIEHAGWLAKGLAGLASIAMPDLITVGGGLANAGDVFIKPLVDAFHREDAGFAGRAIAVEKALLGNEAGFIGAAALARQRMR
jgi:glucokinase